MPCLQIHDLIICIAVARCHGKLMLGAATRTAPHSGRRGVTEPRRPTDAAPPTSRAHRLPPPHLPVSGTPLSVLSGMGGEQVLLSGKGVFSVNPDNAPFRTLELVLLPGNDAFL